MSLLRAYQPFARPASSVLRGLSTPTCRQSPYRLYVQPPRRPHQRKQNPAKQTPSSNIDKAYEPGEDEGYPWPDAKVRYLRPAVWAVSVSAGIYVYLAYLEAKRDPKPAAPRQFRLPHLRTQAPTPTEVATRYWNELNPISKLSAGIIATNGAVHLTKFLAPNYWNTLWHMPALNANYSLFTSTFVHSGSLHLLVNMWACHNFLLPTGYSRVFEGDPYHVLSFFLSAGVLSSYGQHLSTMFSKQRAGIPEIFVRAGGASGALFGLLGVFCLQYPTAGIGIIFVPFTMEAMYVLPAVMAFDLVGMVRGYKFTNLGHAAHLSGALIGAGYSYFDGKSRIWKPLVQFWKKSLKQSK